jgi:hypothetical protein
VTGDRPTILHVEDEELNRALLRAVLGIATSTSS